MLTTDRTSIGRRLAVGRLSNRPPWRLGKPRHRRIVPPLGATLAASVVLGVGVALARAAHEQRTVRRARSRELVLQGGEPLRNGLQRMALEQLDLALEQLGTGASDPPSELAVHETRKALKRVRALMRLLAPALGKDAFAHETSALREVATRLGGARDSEVMLATLEALIERHPRKLARSKGIAALRAELSRECERVREQTLGDPAALALVLSELHQTRVRVEMWRLPECDQLELVEPGLRRLYGQGRRRFRRAARGKGRQMRGMHEWRKRVKDMRYVAEMLQRRERPQAPALPGKSGGQGRRGRKQARRQAKLLHDIAARADQLGEVLGEDHDLAVLGLLVRGRTAASTGKGKAKRKRTGADKDKGAGAKLGRRSRRRLLKAIGARRRKLQRRALREGERLYERSPGKFVRRIRAG